MRLASIKVNEEFRLAFGQDGKVIVPNRSWAQSNGIPLSLADAINQGVTHDDIAPVFEVYHNDSLRHQFLTVLNEDEVDFGPAVPYGRKIVCVGLNYRDHVAESRLELPTQPILFSKFDNALCGHRSSVAKPANTEKLDYEAELVAVIGKSTRNVDKAGALDAVYGYTVANDISARDLQFVTSQWLPGKSCDGFCPIGPFIVTHDEIANPQDLQVSCTVNGEMRQNDNTSLMIFPLDELISYISNIMTLEPGDVILTGTPQGVAMGMPEGHQKWLQPGDIVTAGIDGIGELTVTIC